MIDFASAAVGDWRCDWDQEVLGLICDRGPSVINAGHERAVRAQNAYRDSEGYEYVYGSSVSRAVQQEFRNSWQGGPNFSEIKLPGTNSVVPLIDGNPIFVVRVGKKMPKNHTNINLKRLSKIRSQWLAKTSATQYDHPTLFDIDPEENKSELIQIEQLSDRQGIAPEAQAVLDRLFPLGAKLFVLYFSCSFQGIGSIYFGPGIFEKSRLRIINPVPLEYVSFPVEVEERTSTLSSVRGFNSTERPKPSLKLRKPDPAREQS